MNNSRILATLAASLLSTTAWSQPYPSPTVQNFTALGTVSGAGITSLFASPPPTGGTTPAAGTFTSGQFGNGRTITWSGNQLLPPNLNFMSWGSWTGTFPSDQSNLNGAPLNWFLITDNLKVGASTVPAIEHVGINATMGAAATGDRVMLGGTMSIPVTTAALAAGHEPQFIGLGLNVYGTANQGGTAQTQAGVSGGLWGDTKVVSLDASSTYFRGITGLEIDVLSQPIQSQAPLAKVGLLIPNYPGDVSNGAIIDGAIVVAGTPGLPGWMNGIQFGGTGTNATVGITATTGRMLSSYVNQNLSFPTVNTIADGLYLLETTFGDAVVRAKQTVLGQGTLDLGAGRLTAGSGAIALDAANQVGAVAEGGTIAVGGGGSSGGTGWAVGNIVYDPYGGVYWVSTISTGAVTQLTVVRQPLVNGAAPSNPISFTTRGGNAGAGLTVNLTWTAPATLNLGTATATAVNLGSATANVLVGSGSALATSATTGMLQIGTTTGAPTGTVGASGKGTLIIRTDNHKICHSEGAGTWYYADGTACS